MCERKPWEKKHSRQHVEIPLRIAKIDHEDTNPEAVEETKKKKAAGNHTGHTSVVGAVPPVVVDS